MNLKIIKYRTIFLLRQPYVVTPLGHILNYTNKLNLLMIAKMSLFPPNQFNLMENSFNAVRGDCKHIQSKNPRNSTSFSITYNSQVIDDKHNSNITETNSPKQYQIDMLKFENK